MRHTSLTYYVNVDWGPTPQSCAPEGLRISAPGELIRSLLANKHYPNFQDRVSLCRPGWPGIQRSAASASQCTSMSAMGLSLDTVITLALKQAKHPQVERWAREGAASPLEGTKLGE